ncbi:hypothetical protein J6590_014731 [Homalodisca vitripennis]|nr:hypothetical protein J6590_014731 [Homalodisca vitripennis]
MTDIRPSESAALVCFICVFVVVKLLGLSRTPQSFMCRSTELDGLQFQLLLQPDGSRMFQCIHCNHLYKYKKTLSAHIRYECGKEPQFACPQCPYKAKQRSNLRRIAEMLTSRQPETSKLFCCTACGRRYKRKQHLTGHQRFECGKEPQFACPYCPYKAKLMGNLRRHMSLRHFQATS